MLNLVPQIVDLPDVRMHRLRWGEWVADAVCGVRWSSPPKAVVTETLAE